MAVTSVVALASGTMHHQIKETLEDRFDLSRVSLFGGEGINKCKSTSGLSPVAKSSLIRCKNALSSWRFDFGVTNRCIIALIIE